MADGLVQLPQNLDFLSIWFEEVLVEVIECGLINAMDVGQPSGHKKSTKAIQVKSGLILKAHPFEQDGSK